MFMSPADVLLSWFRGILSICIVIGGVWLIFDWYHSLPETGERVVIVEDDHPVRDKNADQRAQNVVTRQRVLSPLERVSRWRPHWNKQSAILFGGVFLILWSCGGRYLRPSYLLAKKAERRPKLSTGEVHRLQRPDGTEIHMEISGPPQATTVILTHGWSLSREEWAYLQQDWGDQFRMVVWDLPGLGKSKVSPNRVFTLDEMARDLHAVIEASGPEPVVLMGHSIGGMTILTFCQLFPNLLGTRISKLVLVHTTYMNPLRTMFLSGLVTVLQKPLVEPLLYLQIWLSPLCWIMNCLSYHNGSIHASVARNGFSGHEPSSERDFIAGYYLIDSPALLARGTLAMLECDASDVLRRIKIPVLVIGGEQDPVTSVQASQEIATDVGAGKLSTFNPAKHFGLLEYHVEFARQTAEFCSQA
ncbi:MAG: cpo [Planctomycetaceae bacterium]|nr:cpo [Planctomycetaceae bacterium]